MIIERHHGLEKDLKSLKRFPTPKESLEAWERFFVFKGLKETPGIEQYPGFGQNSVFKARVVPLGENCEKSKGYRLVFRLDGETCTILVFSRHGIYNNEQELIDLIRSRLN